MRRRENLHGIRDLLEFALGSSVLDVGCHRGLVGYEFCQRGAVKVHGCDGNRSMIETARNLFYDVVGCDSRFEVTNLAAGPKSVEMFEGSYDIVLLLETLHKIRRESEKRSLELVTALGEKTSRFFAWNGFAEEVDLVESSLGSAFQLVSWSRITQVSAVWQRMAQDA
jgi:SAM-dependent methyltransferase